MMNMQPIESEKRALDEVAAILAGFLYSAAFHWLLQDKAQVNLVVRDVWAVLEADNLLLQVTADGEITKQKLDPGTYVIVQVQSPYVAEPAERGLYAYPLES